MVYIQQPDSLQQLLGLLFTLLVMSLFLLPISLLIGCMAGLYAALFGKIKNRLFAFVMPFVIIVLWLLFWASQDYPGPMLAIINYGYMFLYYPMIVVSILPLANHFMKLRRSWIAALFVTTFIMFILLTLGFMSGDQIAKTPVTSPTYLDNLVKYAISSLSVVAYAIAVYTILIVVVKIYNRYIKKSVKETK
ncbi:MAG TPA: hypothetical protein VGJ92_00710 [Methanocella sp.]|jgi:hypothetical protein